MKIPRPHRPGWLRWSVKRNPVPVTAGQDRYRTLTGLAVLVVACCAAVVSYIHITTLALGNHQDIVAAVLLPVAVDGQVATSSLVLMRAARLGIRAPVWAYLGMGLGIAATLAGNMASGLPYGPVSAVLAGWPAVAFVVSAETAIAMTRRRVRSARRAPDTGPDTKPDTAPDTKPDRAPRPDRTAAAAARRAAIRALLAQQDMTQEELAARFHVDVRTIRRDLKAPANGKVAA